MGEKAYETYGINCSENYKKVAYEFFETKDYFHKTAGRQYRHYIQSFSPDEISKEKVLEIAVKWAEKSFPWHEVFIAVHDDKEHLHSHFIVNTVNFETGIKLHESTRNLDFRKELNDEICIDYGINNKEITRQRGDVVSYDKNKYQIIKKGADITRLAESIIKNMQLSTSKENFISNMQKDGYAVNWNDNQKNIVFTINQNILQGKKEKFRLSNLEKTFNISDFNKDRLLEIFNLNFEKEKKANLKDIIKRMDIPNILEKEKTITQEEMNISEQNKDFELEF